MSDPIHLSKFDKVALSGTEWPLRAKEWVLLQVCKGVAYARGGAMNVEIQTGGVLVCPPGSAITILASVLGPACFRGVNIRLSSLSGFLTPIERECLETHVARQCAPFLCLPADHVLAGRLASVFNQDGPLTLLNRLAFVQSFAELIAPQLNEAVSKGETVEHDGRTRLRQFLSRIPESELADMTLPELGRHLHCCERHASRIFREVCGRSFRSYTSDLRLEKACRLLTQSNHKIIDIALESGHNSLALFNYVFKKRFQMTPTEWRERNAPRPRAAESRSILQYAAALAMLLYGLLGLSRAALAAPQAGGGSTNQAQNAPATNAPAPAAPRFKVDRYEAKGNTLLSSNLLSRILSPYTGEAVDLDTVKKAWAALRLEYRDRGYPTVGVVLPPQQVTNGVIFFEVTEGTLAEVKVLNNHFYGSNNIMRALPDLVFGAGAPILNGKAFQAQVDRANSNPDRQISPEVRPGPEPGTTALILDVKDRLPLHARLEWDDYSPPDTPGLRINANVSYDNLWQLEHSLGFQYGFSPEKMKESLDVPQLPMSPIDWPEISYYSAFYRAPLGPPASVEDQIAQDQTRFGYNETTRQFDVPPATGRPELLFYGTHSTTENSVPGGPLERVVTNSPLLTISQRAFPGFQLTDQTTAGGRFTAPLPSVGGVLSSVSIGLDYKFLRMVTLATNYFYETYVSTNLTTSPPVVTTNHTDLPIVQNRLPSVTYMPFFLGWSGSRADPGGQWDSSLSLEAGTGGDWFTGDRSFPLALAGAGTKASTTSFLVVRPQLSRTQKLFDNYTLYGNLGGQWADEPLINLEQFALGGVSSVQGYKEGEFYADTGWLAQGELRSPIYWMGKLGGGKAFGAGFTGFTDFGRGYLLDAAAGKKLDQSLWGSGAGLNFHLGPHVESHLTFAWALLDSAFTRIGEERTTFSLSAQF
jgi:hemolysin activation/secretion protein/AraC-like DNA-binding protein